MRAMRVSARILREVGASLPRASQAEMAIPSYSHRNPLVRWLFWARLDAAISLAQPRRSEVVVDFGSGTGVLLPSIVKYASDVVATDLHPEPARELASALDLPVQTMCLGGFSSWALANPASVDCIFALDVLEHVGHDELGALSSLFAELLRGSGRLITSGATESVLYKLGRAVAGFKDEYHHRSIFDVDKLLALRWERQRTRVLPVRPLPRAFMLARYRRMSAPASGFRSSSLR